MSDRVTSLSDWVTDTFRLRFSPPAYWAHCDIRFDISHELLSLRPGEDIIKYYNEVIDIKGNGAMVGSFWVTNMRLLWFFPGKCLNLSIGWSTVTGILKAKAHASSAVILASYKTTYEFIFTCQQEDFIEVLTAVFKAYTKSQPYRETILRSPNLLSKGEVITMKSETIFEKILGVFLLSAEAGTIGKLVITSARMVWYSSASLSNLNIPYLQIIKIEIQKSKYGEVLVIHVQTLTKRELFGFRIDPQEKLRQLETQISNLWRIYHDKPIFGVEVEEEELNVLESEGGKQSLDDLQPNILDPEELVNYSNEKVDLALSDEIMYNDYLGLAIQKIQEKTTIKYIWEESF